MKVVGLITEYNPFHNGHKYHIEEAKRITGADYAIAVMSGNFVQRGAPAVIDKYSRTRMALQNGIDLVLELPVCYATGSAEYFAHGAVSLLDKLGIVDYLCFGSECGDIKLLEKAALFLSNPPDNFEQQLQTYLKNGLTYPAARLKAYMHIHEASESSGNQTLSQNASNPIVNILSEPNNILGIEYIKAIKRLSSSIEAVTIKRVAAHYHEQALSDSQKASKQSDSIISSATAIRKAIHTDSMENSIKRLSKSVPMDVYEYLEEQHLKLYPITEDDFSSIIKYKLMTEDQKTLAGYLDVTEALADRLKNMSEYNSPITELIQKIKTKNLTLTRINRALIHILLQLRENAMTEYRSNGYTFYGRILGIKKESSHLLRKIEAIEKTPLITKVSKANKQLDNLGARMLSEDILATHLYNQAVYEKFGTTIPNEFKHGIVIV